MFLFGDDEAKGFDLSDTRSLLFGFRALLLRDKNVINKYHIRVHLRFGMFVVMQPAPLSQVPDKI
jgi:hypothetical protein